MGAKKTGRKMKSAYKKYKASLKTRQKIETAMSMANIAIQNAFQIARAKSFGDFVKHAISRGIVDDAGSVIPDPKVWESAEEMMRCKSGRIVPAKLAQKVVKPEIFINKNTNSLLRGKLLSPMEQLELLNKGRTNGRT